MFKLPPALKEWASLRARRTLGCGVCALSVLGQVALLMRSGSAVTAGNSDSCCAGRSDGKVLYARCGEEAVGKLMEDWLCGDVPDASALWK
jgi:hypothetical protein